MQYINGNKMTIVLTIMMTIAIDMVSMLMMTLVAMRTQEIGKGSAVTGI